MPVCLYLYGWFYILYTWIWLYLKVIVLWSNIFNWFFR